VKKTDALGGARTAVSNVPSVQVWDIVVRVFHWSTVTLFTLAYLIERPRDLHKALGYTLMAILAIRVIWGLFGSRHARFTSFVPSPRRLFAYLGDMYRGSEKRYLGHNPAGGAMIVAMMLTLAGIGVSGWMMGLDAFWGVGWVEELHEGLVSFALVLIAVHVSGVVFSSLRHHENLVRSMITGVKRAKD
jgi:cytochrome b